MLEFYKDNPAQFSDLILRSAPERIHTLLPGMAALNAAADVFGVKEIVTVEYGVREGFLTEEILKKREAAGAGDENKKPDESKAEK